MNEAEMLERDINTAKESLRLGWLHMATASMTRQERIQYRDGLNQTADDLMSLLDRRDVLNGKNI